MILMGLLAIGVGVYIITKAIVEIRAKRVKTTKDSNGFLVVFKEPLFGLIAFGLLVIVLGFLALSGVIDLTRGGGR